MTGFLSPHVIYMDGMLCHVKALHSFPHMVSNSLEDKTATLSDDEMYIPVTKDENNHSTNVESNQSMDVDDNEG